MLKLITYLSSSPSSGRRLLVIGGSRSGQREIESTVGLSRPATDVVLQLGDFVALVFQHSVSIT